MLFFHIEVKKKLHALIFGASVSEVFVSEVIRIKLSVGPRASPRGSFIS